MMMLLQCILLSFLTQQTTLALRYSEDQVGYNLNENKTAIEPRDYWGQWDNHTYEPSPVNWRFPFYVLSIDAYVDGDPTNNEANGTVFEHNWMANQFRFGGDVAGILSDLDYIQGLGIKAIYFTGSMFLNMPWSPDGYGPLDFTLLDRHHGDIAEWRMLMDEIHSRGMYAVLDNTMATMGNLLAFGDGYTNISVPFNWDEYDYLWKDPQRRYHDFQPSNDRNSSCQYPRIWEQDGYLLPQDLVSQERGCRASEFDMYGDIKGTGAYESYQNQLSRFASVQDRLREWNPDVLEKIKIMSCMQIAMLDIDGFRMDKGTQTTLDAMAEWSDYQRQCARRLGKDNFLVVGEIVANPLLAATYIGRGKEPNQALGDYRTALETSNATDPDAFIRPFGMTALDGAAFHYDVYGSMVRFLGIDGPWGADGVDWVDIYNEKILGVHDLVNANTGLFDPRHMFGTTNQDVFRWPALSDGTQRQLLGLFVSHLELPGIPMVFFGEEQEYYIIQSLAPDYVYGRTPFASSRAWQLHGCYTLGEGVYVDMPFNSSAHGCYDDDISLDHRDPSHPLRNYLKRIFELRKQYPTLNDGFNLTALSSRTYNIYLPGSNGMPSPHGIWSVYRGREARVQDLTGAGQGNQGVWLVFGNENSSMTYDFNCSATNTTDIDGPLIAAFDAGTTVKNLFYPYEEYTLQASNIHYALENSTQANGCLPQISLRPWDFKAFVPISSWAEPSPVITSVAPRHDARMLSNVAYDQTESVTIAIQFSVEMDCLSVTNSILINSTTESGRTATLNKASVDCTTVTGGNPGHPGYVATAWMITAELQNVANGVHTYTVDNATSKDGLRFTGSRDKFMLRIGQSDNPMVFPLTSNYTTNLLHRDSQTQELYISPRAAGADKIRYSTNWGSSFSSWMNYTGENITVQKQAWSGTKDQEWTGEHVNVQYWSRMTGSSDHVQHADLDWSDKPSRRWPHAWVEGVYNQWGFDDGIANKMSQDDEGLWNFNLFTEWPTNITVNVWGMNPDGEPDKSAAFGDVDRDNVLDWLPPDTLSSNVINISQAPAHGFIGYRLVANDGNYNYKLVPVGSATVQGVIMILLVVIPPLTAIICVVLFIRFFYQVKFNKIGITSGHNILVPVSALWSRIWHRSSDKDAEKRLITPEAPTFRQESPGIETGGALAAGLLVNTATRRTVLIATMEYEIPDWSVKVKIGGLGVMSNLMGNNLQHQDLIWVVPCLGDCEYPFESAISGEPIEVYILEQRHTVMAYYYVVQNITYVVLDAPIFRRRTKAEPYPPRMDDLESGIYYSAWNQCIAAAIDRFRPDIYHINDYHGTLAPLYLLPFTIPCCLSLHNAEFQGLWNIKSKDQMREICRVFNLEEDVVKKYVQFGEVFNLLHAGASYLRIHQGGYGAVGVSNKYGKRSLARYPIFWGLSKIGALPNPDPTDTAPRTSIVDPKDARVDLVWEEQRSEDRCRAQEWAGLNIDKNADLFIFVGRWSNQKGVDLIADVFYSVLTEHSSVQLICIGPVIDLYGKFAALKLSKLVEQFPGRVYSKPEFTMLPPYIFSGAEFALMPSRDEPFGLVAVEFGRKGALCVGSRVGGFGHMPGWWFTVESITSKHLLSQFKAAINEALGSDKETRALMRAYSKLQRFPVAQWVEDLEKLQSKSISAFEKTRIRAEMTTHGLIRNSISSSSLASVFTHGKRSSRPASGISTPVHDTPGATPYDTPGMTPYGSRPASRAASGPTSRAASRPTSRAPSPTRLRGVNISRDDSGTDLRSLADPPTPSSADARGRGHIRQAARSISLPRYAAFPLPDDLPPLPPLDNLDTQVLAKLHGSVRGTPRMLSPAPSMVYDVPEDEEISAATPEANNSLDLDMAAVKRLSLNSISKDVESTSALQIISPLFDDKRNIYYDQYSDKLDKNLNGKSSEGDLCIEEYLIRSERKWFNNYYAASLRSGTPNSGTSLLKSDRSSKFLWKSKAATNEQSEKIHVVSEYDEYFDSTYNAPRGVAKFMQTKIGTWPLYCFCLALGQIISANSYQLTLLTGSVGEPANKLYVLSSIYIASTACWWMLFRKVKSVYILSAPFIFFGLAFFLLGLSIVTSNSTALGWIYNVAGAIYAIGSSAGTMYFALNFGMEGGTPSQIWAFRAYAIAGTQQLLIAFLWYWGSYLINTNGTSSTQLVSSKALTAITIPLAFLMWCIGGLLYYGLPTYYRQSPGAIPSFYTAVSRRGVVLWFWLYVVLTCYWLSTNYNRNWQFLWASAHAPRWAVALLVIFFFVGVWSLLLIVLGVMSKRHSWIIPIFAIGLGAPRWCQFLWSLSGIAFHVPWVHSPVLGALLARGVWAWLGVLDALQGVGFGMILLMTLTRTHITFTLMMSQMIGAVVTIVARATAPNKVGAGTVFINLAVDSLARPWFWISLICQLVICVGFFKSFRKAQLQKP